MPPLYCVLCAVCAMTLAFADSSGVLAVDSDGLIQTATPRKFIRSEPSNIFHDSPSGSHKEVSYHQQRGRTRSTNVHFGGPMSEDFQDERSFEQFRPLLPRTTRCTASTCESCHSSVGCFTGGNHRPSLVLNVDVSSAFSRYEALMSVVGPASTTWKVRVWTWPSGVSFAGGNLSVYTGVGVSAPYTLQDTFTPSMDDAPMDGSCRSSQCGGGGNGISKEYTGTRSSEGMSSVKLVFDIEEGAKDAGIEVEVIAEGVSQNQGVTDFDTSAGFHCLESGSSDNEFVNVKNIRQSNQAQLLCLSGSDSSNACVSWKNCLTDKNKLQWKSYLERGLLPTPPPTLQPTIGALSGSDQRGSRSALLEQGQTVARGFDKEEKHGTSLFVAEATATDTPGCVNPTVADPWCVLCLDEDTFEVTCWQAGQTDDLCVFEGMCQSPVVCASWKASASYNSQTCADFTSASTRSSLLQLEGAINSSMKAQSANVKSSLEARSMHKATSADGKLDAGVKGKSGCP